MISWQGLKAQAPAIADAGERLLATNEVAFIATVSATGRPRIHPFVPRVVGGQMLAFFMDSSPKFQDLLQRQQYSIHTLPGEADEEFFASGEAILLNEDTGLRSQAADAMGFATGVDEHHVLFELVFDRALHTTWLDFGTPDHRPRYTKWRLS